MTYDNLYPVGIDANWMNAAEVSIPDPCLKNWLLDTSSLTERLQSQCRKFSLQLLGQRPGGLELEEIRQLGADNQVNDEQWQVREVILWGDSEPWVFARSVLPDALCRADLAELGHQPLGQIIFNDARFVRSPFQICQLEGTSALHRTLRVTHHSPLWGRRSIFTYQRHKMMVAEVFLPAAPAYKLMPVTVPHG